MKMVFLLRLFGVMILSSFEVSSSPLSRSSIVGGEDAGEGIWPWQVFLKMKNTDGRNGSCGGSLISDVWVLTAAHCLDSLFYPTSSVVYLGAYQLDKAGSHQVNRTIADVVIHSKYTIPTKGYDIALVKLDRPVPLSRFIQTVPLAEPSDLFTSRSDCWVTGWGRVQQNSRLPFPRTLQKVKIPIHDPESCKNVYPNMKTSMICCGGQYKSTCKGDSGGALVCKKGNRWVQAGIVSYGKGCETPIPPKIFTRVSSYRSWIKIHSQ
ncbi:serine protease 27-like [Lepisosteus oculatus]|uniref:serine protease 27-like n=1 Tax=Lepisosteus oculatus TaxID=7918 RepID=UPI003724621C